MSNQDLHFNKKNIDIDIIISALEKRAKSARITMLIFVYLIFIAMIFIFSSIMMIKSKNDGFIKPLIDIVHSTHEANYTPPSDDLNNPSLKQLRTIHVSTEAFNSLLSSLRISSKILSSYVSNKSTSQELAESVASIVISLTLLILVGFIMKVSIMFIKYHMQIGNDYDNQKIAYLLSKGNVDVFEKTLTSLRTHNITFEKTPSLPQEKIINGLIDTLKTVNKKS